MAKTRIPIPPEIAAAILLRSNRTCCVCNEPGNPVQIHHIDEDPSNNNPRNLAVLCLHCHEDTQLTGGFGRKLDSFQVVAFRDAWFKRVKDRRDSADEIAVWYRGITSKDSSTDGEVSKPTPESLQNYVRILPAIRRDIYVRARQLWDTGVTSNQREGCANVSDVTEQILITLASWYPPNHFDGREPRDYITSVAASRYLWHRAQLQPYGLGKHGTMIGPMVASRVMNDLEAMVIEMVAALSRHFLELDVDGWKNQWEAAAIFPKTQI